MWLYSSVLGLDSLLRTRHRPRLMAKKEYNLREGYSNPQSIPLPRVTPKTLRGMSQLPPSPPGRRQRVLAECESGKMSSGIPVGEYNCAVSVKQFVNGLTSALMPSVTYRFLPTTQEAGKLTNRASGFSTLTLVNPFFLHFAPSQSLLVPDPMTAGDTRHHGRCQ